MITLNELNPKNCELSEDHKKNLELLLIAMNKVRKAYGEPMIVVSGYRSQAHHEQIYKKMKRKPPMGSLHLKGLACDIKDTDGHLWKWCMDNIAVLEQAGLYLEDKSFTPTWVHFQCAPPKSHLRIFRPW